MTHVTRTEYLVEDLRLISRYFPGAETVVLYTPFDLTLAPEDPWKLRGDDCGTPADEVQWYRDPAWNR